MVIFVELPHYSFNLSPLCRHLIGFFLFLSLTIYTAMKVPNVVDLRVLRNADFQKLHAELITCLPSLPHMPDLHRLREELPSMEYLSNWHIMELLSNCLPENLTHNNHTDTCVLVSTFSLLLCFLNCLFFCHGPTNVKLPHAAVCIYFDVNSVNGHKIVFMIMD